MQPVDPARRVDDLRFVGRRTYEYGFVACGEGFGSRHGETGYHKTVKPGVGVDDGHHIGLSQRRASEEMLRVRAGSPDD
jgi:hypothetical protein